MDLILVRHALPLREEVEDGTADPGLTPEGVEQAERLAAWLTAEPVDVLAQSPARRAVETAQPFAERAGLVPETVEGLAEYDVGLASYVPLEELKAAGDERWRATQRGELWGDLDPDEFRDRVVGAVEGLIDAHPGRRVIAVCHGGVINVYTGHILGIERSLWFAAGYTSITRVAASRRGHRNLVSLNEMCHLRG